MSQGVYLAQFHELTVQHCTKQVTLNVFMSVETKYPFIKKIRVALGVASSHSADRGVRSSIPGGGLSPPQSFRLAPSSLNSLFTQLCSLSLLLSARGGRPPSPLLVLSVHSSLTPHITVLFPCSTYSWVPVWLWFCLRALLIIVVFRVTHNQAK